jgi:hypothetical protein
VVISAMLRLVIFDHPATVTMGIFATLDTHTYAIAR